MFDLLTIGDSTIDTFLVLDDASVSCALRRDEKKLCLNYAEKIPIVHSDQSIGGNAANVAVGAHHLGLNTTIVTEVGDDVNGRAIKGALTKTGINTALIKTVKKAETRYSVILNYHSERTILSYHPKRNYTFPALPQTKWIYYTSLSESFEKIQTKLLAHLKKNPSIKLAVNPGSFQIKNGLPTIRRIFGQTDLLIVNKEEAAKLLDQKDSPINMGRALLKKGVGTVVITDSTKGSIALNKNETYFMPIFPVKAIAKTGAGDAYTSGFLSATILGKSLSEAMVWGTANSAGVIQKIGAQQGLLSVSEIKKLVARHKKIKPISL